MRLDLHESVGTLLTAVGWYRIGTATYLTYENLTREFLATLDISDVELQNDEDFEEPQPPKANISFRIFNKHHKITLRQLNEFFGWDPEAINTNPYLKPGRNYDQTRWWQDITGLGPTPPREQYTSLIISPSLRILSRLFHQTLSPKGEYHKMNKQDLALLYTAIYPKDDESINFGWVFIHTCLAVRGDKSTKPIHLGGMITCIAHALGFKDLCDQCIPVSGNPSMTIEVLRNYDFIKGKNTVRSFPWLVAGEPYCFLPNNDLIALDDEFSSWIFPRQTQGHPQNEPPQHQAQRRDVHPPPHSPPHPHFEEGGSSAPPTFNPYKEFPSSYFGDSFIPPPQPPNPFDLTPMYQMLGQLHHTRAQDRAFMEETRQIAWHDHVNLVNAGLVPGYANHPTYPPDFHSPPLPLQVAPGYYPPGHPFYRPPPPPDQ